MYHTCVSYCINIPEYFRAPLCARSRTYTRQIFGDRLMDTRLEESVIRGSKSEGGNVAAEPSKTLSIPSSLRAKRERKRKSSDPNASGPPRRRSPLFVFKRAVSSARIVAQTAMVPRRISSLKCLRALGIAFPLGGAWEREFFLAVFGRWTNEVFRARLLLRGRKVVLSGSVVEETEEGSNLELPAAD